VTELRPSRPTDPGGSARGGQGDPRYNATRFEQRRDDARARLTTQVAPESEGRGRGVLEGAFAILKALPFSPQEGQVAALADVTRIPRSSVHRLLDQLVGVGVVSLSYGRYLLTSEMLVMAELNEPVVNFRPVAERYLQVLRERTGATVTCVVSEGTSAYVLNVVPGAEKLPADLYPGRQLPPGAAASLLLAPGRTGAEGQQFVTDREDVIPGLTCYATKIRFPDGRVAALQLCTPPSSPAEHFATLTNRVAAVIGDAMASTNGDRR
jgi:IclR family acetate operon transcriptional repressor